MGYTSQEGLTIGLAVNVRYRLDAGARLHPEQPAAAGGEGNRARRPWPARFAICPQLHCTRRIFANATRSTSALPVESPERLGADGIV